MPDFRVEDFDVYGGAANGTTIEGQWRIFDGEEVIGYVFDTGAISLIRPVFQSDLPELEGVVAKYFEVAQEAFAVHSVPTVGEAAQEGEKIEKAIEKAIKKASKKGDK